MNHGWGRRAQRFIALIKAASKFDTVLLQPAGSAWLLFLSLKPFTILNSGLAAGLPDSEQLVRGCDVH